MSWPPQEVDVERIVMAPMKETAPVAGYRAVRVMPLICSEGHQWDSDVIGFDWDGAVLLDKFCPECCRPGSRPPFTPDDLGGYVTQAQLDELGREAHPTLAILLAFALAESPDWNKASYGQIAQIVCDTTAHVAGHVERINSLGLIARAPTDAEGVFEFAPGPMLGDADDLAGITRDRG